MARFAWLILCALLLAGCGQKGPLYMPDDEQAAERFDPQDALPDPVQSSSSQDGSSQNRSSEDSPAEKDGSTSQSEN
ncbi:lipoprotein [Pistricoccus aurantiacus]|uniref:Lipoprotein n=1 Tax=Pistricoccus aurantiacus TaxID=1883414 RepID=A0A5B8SN16_9GAMM|nr:lipoprotein [Pistricoccus aurantiacus]